MIAAVLIKRKKEFPTVSHVFELNVNGHTKDTICAAVSSITRSVGKLIENYKGHPGILIDIKACVPGEISLYMELDCNSVQFYIYKEISAIFKVFETALDLLQNEFPEDVSFTIISGGK
jgi:uncharacterized protein YsxB (DUF464 family)